MKYKSPIILYCTNCCYNVMCKINLKAISLILDLAGFLDQEKDAAPVWWLEGSSYPIQILNKRKVKVLVRSEELKKRYKHDPVIISFEWGKGVVYHMISHFYLQRSETRTQKQGNACIVAHCSGHGPQAELTPFRG